MILIKNSIAIYTFLLIRLIFSAFMMETSLVSLKRLGVIKDLLKGYSWIENLFWLGLAAKYEKESAKEEIKKRALSKTKISKSSIIILAGGSNTSDKQKLDSYGELLLNNILF